MFPFEEDSVGGDFQFLSCKKCFLLVSPRNFVIFSFLHRLLFKYILDNKVFVFMSSFIG